VQIRLSHFFYEVQWPVILMEVCELGSLEDLVAAQLLLGALLRRFLRPAGVLLLKRLFGRIDLRRLGWRVLLLLLARDCADR